MREILFRGKRMDNGEWIEGHLLTVTLQEETAYLIFADSFKIVCGEVKASLHALVYPATVGQYTGLKDKHGKPIFEGDIVRYYERQFDGADAPVIHSVGYEEGGFCVRYYFLNNWLRNAFNGNIQLEGIEVIGNVHDNPELIGDDRRKEGDSIC